MYELQYLGVRIRNLLNRLNEVSAEILAQCRYDWTAINFDLAITGFEWNHGVVRPHFAMLSKPSNSNTFEMFQLPRRWYIPRGKRFPVNMCFAPRQNMTLDELKSIENRLDSVWGDGHGKRDDVADHAERLLAEAIQDVSERLNVVGPDTMSILIEPPTKRDRDPTIRIRYIPAGRDKGLLVRGETQTPIPIAFSPWIISPGCIRSPTVFTNLHVESRCGPYQVVTEAPFTRDMPGVVSSQQRPSIG
jgi:hypothetical protein